MTNITKLIDCVYHDIEKICIHPSMEFESPLICNPYECDYRLTDKDAEDYLGITVKSVKIKVPKVRKIEIRGGKLRELPVEVQDLIQRKKKKETPK